jgi:hypothetical protein
VGGWLNTALRAFAGVTAAVGATAAAAVAGTVDAAGAVGPDGADAAGVPESAAASSLGLFRRERALLVFVTFLGWRAT